VAHVEAGLRSFDPSMPEEHNRRLTDHVSSLLLAHSQGAVENLAREAISGEAVHLVGNTMIDSLLACLPLARTRDTLARFGVEPGQYGLVTLHRPSLVDEPELLGRAATALVDVASAHPLVFPVHPRTRIQLDSLGLHKRMAEAGVIVTEPLRYLDFLCLEASALFVITDSGGVQEETTALGVPCFTIRRNTERPVTVELGTNTVLGADPERIVEIPHLLGTARRGGTVPFWDGKAGERAAGVLIEFLHRASP
jgi:UDP-N-acetylglucosamine 2-epimerase (non-hydrolysing)